MTATTLGLIVSIAYATTVVVGGLALSLARHAHEHDPDPEVRAYFADVDITHPMSVWIADRLDKKRGKSRKPRA